MTRRKLRLDTLTVESFATGAQPGARGTVHAHESLIDTQYHSCGWSDPECPTQGCRTDWNTCGAYGSCCPVDCW